MHDTTGPLHLVHIFPERDEFRQATFYDMHLATSFICKKLIHVKNLHRKISVIVDKKLEKIRQDNITLQPPTVPGFIGKDRRDAKLYTRGGLLRSLEDVQDYYLMVSDFCLSIASSLALHPKLWGRIIAWSRVPENQGLASYSASLQFVPLGRVEERYVPDLMESELLEQLKKVEARSNDLATWEMRSLSVKDTSTMLGVLNMALSSGEDGFRWKFCSGTPCAPVLDSTTKKLNSARNVDASKTLHFLQEAISAGEDVSKTLDSLESILDDSLRRGGSSLPIRPGRYLLHGVRARNRMGIRVRNGNGGKGGVDGAENREDVMEPTRRRPCCLTGVNPKSLLLIGMIYLLSHADLHCKQAWGQSVRQDSTLIVLHAGNYEYVCIRHR